MKSLLTSNLAYAVVVVMAVLVAALYIRSLAAEKEALEQTVGVVTVQRDTERAINEDTRKGIQEVQAIGTLRAASSTRIRTITKEITREVPVLLSSAGAAGLLLPDEYGLLHDAAATGRAEVLGGSAPGRADGTPIRLEDAAQAVVENYGTALDTADRLEKLQDWACTVAPEAAPYCTGAGQ